MDLALQDLGDYIVGHLPDEVEDNEIKLGELILSAKADGVIKVLKFLRDDVNCRFKQLVDICGGSVFHIQSFKQSPQGVSSRQRRCQSQDFA